MLDESDACSNDKVVEIVSNINLKKKFQTKTKFTKLLSNQHIYFVRSDYFANFNHAHLELLFEVICLESNDDPSNFSLSNSCLQILCKIIKMSKVNEQNLNLKLIVLNFFRNDSFKIEKLLSMCLSFRSNQDLDYFPVIISFLVEDRRVFFDNICSIGYKVSSEIEDKQSFPFILNNNCISIAPEAFIILTRTLIFSLNLQNDSKKGIIQSSSNQSKSIKSVYSFLLFLHKSISLISFEIGDNSYDILYNILPFMLKHISDKSCFDIIFNILKKLLAIQEINHSSLVFHIDLIRTVLQKVDSRIVLDKQLENDDGLINLVQLFTSYCRFSQISIEVMKTFSLKIIDYLDKISSQHLLIENESGRNKFDAFQSMVLFLGLIYEESVLKGLKLVKLIDNSISKIFSYFDNNKYEMQYLNIMLFSSQIFIDSSIIKFEDIIIKIPLSNILLYMLDLLYIAQESKDYKAETSNLKKGKISDIFGIILHIAMILNISSTYDDLQNSLPIKNLYALDLSFNLLNAVNHDSQEIDKLSKSKSKLEFIFLIENYKNGHGHEPIRDFLSNMKEWLSIHEKLFYEDYKNEYDWGKYSNLSINILSNQLFNQLIIVLIICKFAGKEILYKYIDIKSLSTLLCKFIASLKQISISLLNDSDNLPYNNNYLKCFDTYSSIFQAALMILTEIPSDFENINLIVEDLFKLLEILLVKLRQNFVLYITKVQNLIDIFFYLLPKYNFLATKYLERIKIFDEVLLIMGDKLAIKYLLLILFQIFHFQSDFLSSDLIAKSSLSWIIIGSKLNSKEQLLSVKVLYIICMKHPTFFKNYLIRPEIENFLISFSLGCYDSVLAVHTVALYINLSKVNTKWLLFKSSYSLLDYSYFKLYRNLNFVINFFWGIFKDNLTDNYVNLNAYLELTIVYIQNYNESLTINKSNILTPLASNLLKVLQKYMSYAKLYEFFVIGDEECKFLKNVLNIIAFLIDFGAYENVNIEFESISNNMTLADSFDIYCYICEFLLCINITKIQLPSIGKLTVEITYDVINRTPKNFTNKDDMMTRMTLKWGEIFHEILTKGIVNAFVTGDQPIEIADFFFSIILRISTSNELNRESLINLKIYDVIKKYLILITEKTNSIDIYTKNILISCCSIVCFIANQEKRIDIFFKNGILDLLLTILKNDFCNSLGPDQIIQINCLKGIRSLALSNTTSDYIIKSNSEKIICESADYLTDLILCDKLDSTIDPSTVILLLDQITIRDDVYSDRCLIS